MSQFEEEESTNQNMKTNYVKLFVGQIPREMDEDTLMPYFSEFGPIVELTVIRDRVSKIHKGCAFVTYLEPDSAFRAIEQLHDKIKLGNAINPLQVRIAECQVERENKLFIGMLPKTINEEQLHDMFVKFGDLREVHIIRGPEGSSKGCAFVKYVERDAAVVAIQEMHTRVPEGSTRPLVVKFADVKKHGKKVDNEEAFVVDKFAAMSVRSNGSNSNYWTAQQSNQPYLVSYGYSVPPQQVLSAMPLMQYGSTAHHPGNSSPYILVPGGYGGDEGRVPPPSYQLSPGTEAVKKSMVSMSGPSGSEDMNDADMAANRPPEGPSGANLFIYHLPRDLTDADLATLFATFGNVISAKVFVDKKTSDSKGFGFVSFDSVESANAAINAMNGFQIGSKRLKVQHKRTHDGLSAGNVGSGSAAGSVNGMGIGAGGSAATAGNGVNGVNPGSVPLSSLHIQPPLQLLSQPTTLHTYMPTYLHPSSQGVGSLRIPAQGAQAAALPGSPTSQMYAHAHHHHTYRMNPAAAGNVNVNVPMYSAPVGTVPYAGNAVYSTAAAAAAPPNVVSAGGLVPADGREQVHMYVGKGYK